MTAETAPSIIVLDAPSLARAARLATSLDAAMAASILAADDDEGIDIVTMGIGAVVDRLGTDPQAFLDENIGWVMLLFDALAWVTGEHATPSPRVLAYAPDLV